MKCLVHKLLGEFVNINNCGMSLNRVIETKNPNYSVNDLVLVYSGWVTHSISNGDKGIHKIPANGSLPPSTRLGIIGMPG